MAGDRKVRVWRVSKNSSAGIEITDNSAVVAGSRANFIAAHGAGITLMGKSISFGVPSENIREGGMFVRLNDFVQMIPSTLVTPMPNHIPYPPFGLATAMLGDLPFFMGMLSAGPIASTLI